MKYHIRGYITHKEAELYSDCADRYAINKELHRFAIADGVSKSFFPDVWAEILVNEFVRIKYEGFDIEDCQKEWHQQVAKRATTNSAKWFTRNAFAKRVPGLATFVNLRFEDDKWFAEALGDSFLFFVSTGCSDFEQWIKLSSKPEDNVVFDSYPDYYSSYNQEHGEKRIYSDVLKPGVFYLMTDALAEWVFNEKEAAIQLINDKWTSQSEYETSIEELRKTGRLHNDDSAILILTVEDDGQKELTCDRVDVQDLKELIKHETQSAPTTEDAGNDSVQSENEQQPPAPGTVDEQKEAEEQRQIMTPKVEKPEAPNDSLKEKSPSEIEGLHVKKSKSLTSDNKKEEKDITKAFNDIKKQINKVFKEQFKDYNKTDKKRLEGIVLTKIKEEYVISIKN